MSASFLRTRRHILAAGSALVAGLLSRTNAEAGPSGRGAVIPDITPPDGGAEGSSWVQDWVSSWMNGSQPGTPGGRRHHHHHGNWGGGGGGGDFHPTCFLAGTAIATPDGPRAIETLGAGDRVVSPDGTSSVIRRMVVHRIEPSQSTGWSRHVHPVKIQAGALGQGVPARDLYVSPGHSMLVDGRLVMAKDLVNGSSVTYAVPDGLTMLTYWHVECDRHEIIVAEGAATESRFNAALHHAHAAPVLRYDGVAAHVTALARLGVSPLIDRRDPLQRSYDRIASRARSMAKMAA